MLKVWKLAKAVDLALHILLLWFHMFRRLMNTMEYVKIGSPKTGKRKNPNKKLSHHSSSITQPRCPKSERWLIQRPSYLMILALSNILTKAVLNSIFTFVFNYNLEQCICSFKIKMNVCDILSTTQHNLDQCSTTNYKLARLMRQYYYV